MSTKQMSMMDQRRLAELEEAEEVALKHADLPFWTTIWRTQNPPFFDKLTPAPWLLLATKTEKDEEKDDATALLIVSKLIPETARRCLVPGCGRGCAVTALASKNRYVLGVDIVPRAIDVAKERLIAELEFLEKLEIEAPFGVDKAEFKCQDFFKLDSMHPENLWDFVLDEGFLCHLDLRVWQDWAKKMASLVKIGGTLAVLVYPIMERTDKPTSPPYPLSSTASVRDVLLETCKFKPQQIDFLPPHLCHEGQGGGQTDAGSGSGSGSGSNRPRTALMVFLRVNEDELDHDDFH